MIKTVGTYFLSLDGGKTFKDYGNMLVTGYYNKIAIKSLSVLITSNGTPPTFQDSSISGNVGAHSNEGFSEFSLEITQDSYKIHCSTTFDIGVGNSLVARDIKIINFNTLFSRALFKDEDGNPLDIPITPKDNIVVKYVLTYNLPKGDIPISVSIHNKLVDGVIKVCNPNIWGTSTISLPIVLENVGVAPHNTWIPDENGYIDSGLTSQILPLTDSYFTSSDLKKNVYTAIAGLDSLNITFRQIAFSKGSLSPRNIALLINLNEDVVNTPDDYLSLGIEVKQGVFT